MANKITAKTISIYVLIFSIFSKTAIDYFFLSIDRDRLYQVLATINLANGHGLSIAHVHASNLSKIVFEPLIGWPPGYSLFLYPFYMLLGKNIMLSTMCVDIFFIALFLIILRNLLLLLNFPAYLVNFLVLFNGLNIPDYIRQSTATDLPAMVLCLCSCYLLVSFVQNSARKSSFGIVLGLVNAMAGFMRYIYIPLSAVIPLFLAWNAFKKKDRRLLAGSGYSFLATSICLFVFFSFQKYSTGNYLLTNPGSISPAIKGLFFSNLKYTHPFVISSILNLDFYITQLSIHTGIPYYSLLTISGIIGFILLAFLLFIFFWYCIKKKLVWRIKEDVFFMAAGLICFLSFVLLCYLSITNSRAMNSIYFRAVRNFTWTYVEEGRYFAFTWIFLQVFFAWWLFIYKPQLYKSLQEILKTVFCIFLVAEIFHGIYFITKKSFGDKKNYSLSATEINDNTKSIINKIILDNQKRNVSVVVASANADFCNWSALSGGNALYHIEELNKFFVRTERPTLLVIALKENEEEFLLGFFSKNGEHKTAKTGAYNLFTYYIQPDEIK